MKHISRLAALTALAVFTLSVSVYAEDDDLFDDTVVDAPSQTTPSGGTVVSADTQSAAQSDIAHGTIFQNGTVKIGGQFDMSLTSLTRFNSEKSAGESIRQTVLTPLADAQFTLDARPSDNLRLFFKGGVHYPYLTESNASVSSLFTSTNTEKYMQNLFYVKELFTDFALYDTSYFRFGKQTITWGTGYFFSPAGNTVNLTAIDPEDTTKQVEGPLALRTQIVFKGTQNCLWLYMIPDSTLFTLNGATYTFASDTAFAAKGDVVLGGWELGLAGYYKYARAPKGILTASGTLFNKISTFGEFVYAYGTDTDWAKSTDWSGKDSVVQATAGLTYTWKEPQITFAAQYYYDGNDKDSWDQTTHGHNAAVLVSFAKVGTTDVTATVYGDFNFGADISVATAMLYYSPLNELKLGAGPYVIWYSYDQSPDIAAKLSVTLGGGKF